MSVGTERDILDEFIERYGNWGRWGPDDQLGSANLVTPFLPRAARKFVRYILRKHAHGVQSGRSNAWVVHTLQVHLAPQMLR